MLVVSSLGIIGRTLARSAARCNILSPEGHGSLTIGSGKLEWGGFSNSCFDFVLINHKLRPEGSAHVIHHRWADDVWPGRHPGELTELQK